MFSRLVLGLLLACITFGSAVAQSSEQPEDLTLIRQTIDSYFQGHATGEGHYQAQAFHPKATLFWVRDGKLNERPSAEYIAAHNGTPAQDEAERKRRIVSIDISGTAALVKVELDYPRALIYDYMSMLKIDGRWQIINKTFYVEPRGE